MVLRWCLLCALSRPPALPRQVTYDVMDVDAKQFDTDFYSFRVVIKELERRLAAIIIQAGMSSPARKAESCLVPWPG